MPSAETLERFIARVEANAHADALEEFYTEEARRSFRCGRAAQIVSRQGAKRASQAGRAPGSEGVSDRRSRRP